MLDKPVVAIAGDFNIRATMWAEVTMKETRYLLINRSISSPDIFWVVMTRVEPLMVDPIKMPNPETQYKVLVHRDMLSGDMFFADC